MKKLLIFSVMCFLCFTGCKKEDPSPNQNNPPPAGNSLSLTEESLLGQWFIQKIEIRDANNILTNTDTSGHSTGDNTVYQSSHPETNPGYLDCIVTYFGNSMLMIWKADGDTIVPPTGAVHRILKLTSTELVYTAPYDTTHGGTRYYYKKQ